MKSDSVKGRPRVGSWNSPESPSGAANSQISRRAGLASPHGLGLSPRLQVTVPREGSRSVHFGESQAGGGRCRQLRLARHRVSPVFTPRKAWCPPSLILGPNVPAWKAAADGLPARSLLPSPQGCFFLCLLRTRWRGQTVLSSAQAVPGLVRHRGASRFRGCRGLPSIFKRRPACPLGSPLWVGG